jgi:hypothetical protein
MRASRMAGIASLPVAGFALGAATRAASELTNAACSWGEASSPRRPMRTPVVTASGSAEVDNERGGEVWCGEVRWGIFVRC